VRNRLSDEQRLDREEGVLRNHRFPSSHEGAFRIVAMLPRALRVVGRRLTWLLRVVVVSAMTVAVAAVAVVIGASVFGTNRPLSRVCVVRTATHREMQHESCGGNEGNDRSHGGPTKGSSNCSLCWLLGQYRQKSSLGPTFIMVERDFRSRAQVSESRQSVIRPMALNHVAKGGTELSFVGKSRGKSQHLLLEFLDF